MVLNYSLLHCKRPAREFVLKCGNLSFMCHIVFLPLVQVTSQRMAVQNGHGIKTQRIRVGGLKVGNDMI